PVSWCRRRGESRGKHREEGEAGEWNQREARRLISKMNVIGDDEARLDRRHDHEKDDSEGMFEDGKVTGRGDCDFESGDHKEYREDRDVRSTPNRLADRRGLFRYGRFCQVSSPQTRYTIVKRKIHTTSTKCQ